MILPARCFETALRLQGRSFSNASLLEPLPILDMVARLIRAPPVCAETALPLDSRGSALFPPQNYVVTRRNANRIHASRESTSAGTPR